MAKQENLVKKIKSNLCGVFLCKNGNYECINYENDLLEIPKSDKILTPLVNTKSRSRLPIYYKSPFVTIRRRNVEINNDYLMMCNLFNGIYYLIGDFSLLVTKYSDSEE